MSMATTGQSFQCEPLGPEWEMVVCPRLDGMNVVRVLGSQVFVEDTGRADLNLRIATAAMNFEARARA